MVSRSAVGPASCTLRALLAVVLGVAGVAASSAALAHGRFYGPRVGVYIGGPVWPRYYYGPAYYPYAYPYPYYYQPYYYYGPKCFYNYWGQYVCKYY